jgi:hypothetical protein
VRGAHNCGVQGCCMSPVFVMAAARTAVVDAVAGCHIRIVPPLLLLFAVAGAVAGDGSLSTCWCCHGGIALSSCSTLPHHHSQLLVLQLLLLLLLHECSSCC